MNVLLITIDCLRADHLSCMGYERQTSPFMDSLADNGILFTQAIVNGVGTFASFPALMTSTYPFMHGGYGRINRETIAEALQKRGYLTAGFNDNSYLSPFFGYDRGFDDFNCLSLRKGKALKGKLKEKGKQFVSQNEYMLRFATKVVHYIIPPDCNMNGAIINRKVLLWLRENYVKNFFLWIHYMDVHGGHYAPKEYFKRLDIPYPSRRALIKLNDKLGSDRTRLYRSGRIGEGDIEMLKATYDAEIIYVDDCIKELFEELASLGIDKDTAVIITGDHGEEFFEHGNYHSHENFYDEMLHVPFILYAPNIPHKIIDRQVEQIDMAPTILDLLGLQCEDSFIGRSLLNKDAGSEYVISEVALDYISGVGNQRLIRIDFSLRKTSIRFDDGNERWKYINSSKENREELYNLNKDPFEKNNLIEEKEGRESLEMLRGKFKEHIRLEEEQKRIKDRIKRIKLCLSDHIYR